MKVGDIVTLRDGSYSMTLIKGVLEYIVGIPRQSRRYRVLGLGGVYPTYNYNTHEVTHGNETMLVDVDNLDFILFTQERFCDVVTPAPAKFPPDQIEIVVARGTKEVHLILQ